PESMRAAHRLRAGFDGVLVGANTARADDPRLTVRDAGVVPRVPPARMVLDARATLGEDRALFRESEGPAVVFVRDDADAAAVARLERAGARVHRVRG